MKTLISQFYQQLSLSRDKLICNALQTDLNSYKLHQINEYLQNLENFYLALKKIKNDIKNPTTEDITSLQSDMKSILEIVINKIIYFLEDDELAIRLKKIISQSLLRN